MNWINKKNIAQTIAILAIMLIVSMLSFAQPKLTYTLSPRLTAETPYLKVSFEAKTSGKGELILQYDDNFWGQTKLYNCLKNLTTQPKAQSIEMYPDSSYIKVVSKPNALLKISYHIVQDKPGKIAYKHCYRPIVQPTYFHSFGHHLFVLPQGALNNNEARLVGIRWRNVARDFVTHNSFGDAPNQTVWVKQEDLFASIFVAGDFKRYSFKIKGKDVHFLTRGKWENFSTDKIAELLKKTIHSQRTFWQDYSDSTYTVTLIDTYANPQSYSIGGTNLTQSFASYCSGNKHTTLERVKYLYNHELMHHWIGKKIVNAKAEKQYWFSEGFTDYYAYKLMLKSGLIGLPRFLKTLNREVLAKHYISKVKSFPNDSLTYQKYWRNYAYQKLSYHRGALYALLLDTQIKQKTKQRKSLDNLMFDLIKVCSGNKTRKLDHKLFKKYLKRYLGKTSLKDFERYIVGGQPIDFEGKLWKEIDVVKTAKYPQFKLVSEAATSDLLKKLIR